jgi:antitoxin CcdA
MLDRQNSQTQVRDHRKATNVSLPLELVEEARRLDINLSRACEIGLAKAVADARAKAWLDENREALQGSNDWVENNGLPLASLRRF